MGLRCTFRENLTAKTGAKTAETVYAIQYESYGSCPRESIDSLAGILARLMPGVSIMLALGAGLVLRLTMLKQFFDIHGDPLIYGGLAKNLLLHGSYALTGGGGELCPTLIRLPGYPLFLALCFRFFGMENYVSAAWVQIALELAGCLLLADFAGRIARRSGTGSAAAPHTPRCGWRRCARSRRFTQPSRLPSR